MHCVQSRTVHEMLDSNGFASLPLAGNTALTDTDSKVDKVAAAGTALDAAKGPLHCNWY